MLTLVYQTRNRGKVDDTCNRAAGKAPTLSERMSAAGIEIVPGDGKAFKKATVRVLRGSLSKQCRVWGVVMAADWAVAVVVGQLWRHHPIWERMCFLVPWTIGYLALGYWEWRCVTRAIDRAGWKTKHIERPALMRSWVASNTEVPVVGAALAAKRVWETFAKGAVTLDTLMVDGRARIFILWFAHHGKRPLYAWYEPVDPENPVANKRITALTTEAAITACKELSAR